MTGIDFIMDADGNKKAVVIDIRIFGEEIIEDLLDGLEAEAVRKEPTISYDEFRKQLIAEGRLAK